MTAKIGVAAGHGTLLPVTGHQGKILLRPYCRLARQESFSRWIGSLGVTMCLLGHESSKRPLV